MNGVEESAVVNGCSGDRNGYVEESDIHLRNTKRKLFSTPYNDEVVVKSDSRSVVGDKESRVTSIEQLFLTRRWRDAIDQSRKLLKNSLSTDQNERVIVVLIQGLALENQCEEAITVGQQYASDGNISKLASPIFWALLGALHARLPHDNRLRQALCDRLRAHLHLWHEQSLESQRHLPNTVDAITVRNEYVRLFETLLFHCLVPGGDGATALLLLERDVMLNEKQKHIYKQCLDDLLPTSDVSAVVLDPSLESLHILKDNEHDSSIAIRSEETKRVRSKNTSPRTIHNIQKWWNMLSPRYRTLVAFAVLFCGASGVSVIGWFFASKRQRRYVRDSIYSMWKHIATILAMVTSTRNIGR